MDAGSLPSMTPSSPSVSPASSPPSSPTSLAKSSQTKDTVISLPSSPSSPQSSPRQPSSIRSSPGQPSQSPCSKPVTSPMPSPMPAPIPMEKPSTDSSFSSVPIAHTSIPTSTSTSTHTSTVHHDSLVTVSLSDTDSAPTNKPLSKDFHSPLVSRDFNTKDFHTQDAVSAVVSADLPPCDLSLASAHSEALDQSPVEEPVSRDQAVEDSARDQAIEAARDSRSSDRQDAHSQAHLRVTTPDTHQITDPIQTSAHLSHTEKPIAPHPLPLLRASPVGTLAVHDALCVDERSDDEEEDDDHEGVDWDGLEKSEEETLRNPSVDDSSSKLVLTHLQKESTLSAPGVSVQEEEPTAASSPSRSGTTPSTITSPTVSSTLETESSTTETESSITIPSNTSNISAPLSSPPRIEQPSSDSLPSINTCVGSATPRRKRPPSMAKLRRLVEGPTPPSLRYSQLPQAPAMTDLEFYAALVKDYKQTASRLPTLLSTKIHKGVPPPLRGVVWQSISGSRDSGMEVQFHRSCHESSPYELIIGKDLHRSFPGVDMFSDPAGEGQKMLGRVLKCFSLYDKEIGYCQGLAFLVGPLLMHMPDRHAFCVLVSLMERYRLRSCFLPDLSGLHLRIFQFRELLKSEMPALSAHLDSLQVDPVYASQWFLSLFAVTCPLPLLFRIYDVLFTEGAPETLLRVALSVMRKNQARLLSYTDMEDALQLLLSRGIWDGYHYNADELVQDFVSFTSSVDEDKLAALEASYLAQSNLSEDAATVVPPARMSKVSSAASRFLGRIFTASASPSSASQANTTPTVTTTTPTVTLNGDSASTAGTLETSTTPTPDASARLAQTTGTSSAQTTCTSSAPGVTLAHSAKPSPSSSPTTVPNLSALPNLSPVAEAGPTDKKEGHSSAPVTVSSGRGTKKHDERELHGQIEGLLVLVGELQRNEVRLERELQHERAERKEDKKAVVSLLEALQKTDSTTPGLPKETDEENERLPEDEPSKVDGDLQDPSEGVAELLTIVRDRFENHGKKRASGLVTASHLRVEVDQAKTELGRERGKSHEYSRKAYLLDQENTTLKEQLRESHLHVRNLHREKQRLEKQVQALRSEHGKLGRGTAAKPEPKGIGAMMTIGGGSSTPRDRKRDHPPTSSPSPTSQSPFLVFPSGSSSSSSSASTSATASASSSTSGSSASSSMASTFSLKTSQTPLDSAGSSGPATADGLRELRLGRTLSSSSTTSTHSSTLLGASSATLQRTGTGSSDSSTTSHGTASGPGSSSSTVGHGSSSSTVGKNHHHHSSSGGTFTRRTSSLSTKTTHSAVGEAAGVGALSAEEHAALLRELAEAKIATAMVKQEAAELEQSLSLLRKTYGLSPSSSGRTTPTGGGVAGNASASSGGSFWGWRR